MYRIIVITVVVFTLTACKNQTQKNSQNRAAMETFKETVIDSIQVSSSKLIGQDWMLITAGQDTNKFNTMTASWGATGHLWGKNVAMMFIRPQRYTKEFVDANEFFTLSFFDEQYRSALNICGTKSGRDGNKVQEAGLTPMATPAGSVAFKEANMIIVCRKLYATPFDPAMFIDTTIVSKIYPEKDFHTMYVGEIIKVYRK